MTNWYGSVHNRMAEGIQIGELHVGMGATEMLYSDRRPYTVQKIISPSRVIVTADKYKRTDHNGQSESQTYDYESTPLLVEETKMRCTHLGWTMLGAGECPYTIKHKDCVGCEFFKKTTPSNGITLIKTKRGWKELGGGSRFALGIREKYDDPCF